MLDRVRIEVIRNALRLAAEEMGTAVVRASFSSIIQEMAEASACVLTADGRLVHGPQPIHSSSLRLGLRAVVEDFPLDSMVEGDVYVTNDPYRGGIHANDLLVIKPVFVDGRPAYFTATLVHVADLGGASAGGLPANVTDFYGESRRELPLRCRVLRDCRASCRRNVHDAFLGGSGTTRRVVVVHARVPRRPGRRTREPARPCPA